VEKLSNTTIAQPPDPRLSAIYHARWLSIWMESRASFSDRHHVSLPLALAFFSLESL
jgi:hypothetical protein